MSQSEKIIKRDDDFAKWYTSVIKTSNIIDYGLIKGTIILKPYGFKIWENIKKEIDYIFSKIGVENCYLPLMIPYSEFIKEKNHIDGFAPELFKVTELNGQKLEDPYVIRPTSEISFCHYFKENIKNYNDLPMKLNQWCSVFRVEKNTKPFLRNSEFFWQEQHCVFSSSVESNNFSKLMIETYQNFFHDFLAIPTISGKKTESEKFAGAVTTYTIEAMMQDGQALQSGTSHDLGSNFSDAFNIKYQDKDNLYKKVYQTSAGISSRLIGAIIMVHGDDKGLVLPPKIAPIQIKINSLFANKNIGVLTLCKEIKNKLSSFRILIDDSDKQLGFKMFDGETKGVPIQINIGPKSLESKDITIIVRNQEEKIVMSLEKITEKYINSILDNFHSSLYDNAKKMLENKIIPISNMEEFKKAIMEKKFVICFWSGTSNDEDEIKKNTGATARCLVDSEDGICFYSGRKTNKKAYFGRAY